MTRDLSVEYDNVSFISGAVDMPPVWAAKAAAYRAALGGRARCDIPYGTAPRQLFDLLMPESTPRGLLVFIHGGYWLKFDQRYWTHLAHGALAHGWAVAMVGYTLAPEARIAAITDEIEAAITEAAKLVTGPIIVAGHSAGGHLAARMACTDRTPEWADRLKRVVPISPVADLEPLMQTKMNIALKIDAAEAAAESPVRLARRGGVACIIWVGGQERPVFLWQARALSEHWDCLWHVDAGKHHFSVLDALEDPDSLLVKTMLAQLKGP